MPSFAVDIADANTRLQRSGHFPTLGFNASYGEFTNNALDLTNDTGDRLVTTALQQEEFAMACAWTCRFTRAGRSAHAPARRVTN